MEEGEKKEEREGVFSRIDWYQSL